MQLRNISWICWTDRAPQNVERLVQGVARPASSGDFPVTARRAGRDNPELGYSTGTGAPFNG